MPKVGSKGGRIFNVIEIVGCQYKIDCYIYVLYKLHGNHKRKSIQQIHKR